MNYFWYLAFRLYQSMVLNKENIHQDINQVWQKFEEVLIRAEGLINHVPVFQDYCYEALRELNQDNVQYLEIRALLGAVSLRIIILPFQRRGRGILFLLCLSICNQYFPSNFSQQPSIKTTSNLVWCFGCRSYMLLTESTSASYLLSVLKLSLYSDITWSSAKFLLHFFQQPCITPLQTSYGALARGPNSGGQGIYLLYYDYFPT